MSNHEEWLKRARYNFKLSKSPIEEETVLEELCFNAQQAVEKALKGLLVYYKTDPEHTHNINRLLDKLINFTTIPDSIYKTVELTKYAHKTRYPGNFKDISIEEYKRLIAIADNCLDWVDKLIYYYE